jgi:hypothetical protein
MLYRIGADVIVVLHAIFVAFVAVGGFLSIRWPIVAWVHLPAAAWGVLIEVMGWVCPVTPLENVLRVLGGQSGYSGDFIEHYLMPIVYPAELTRGTQWVMAASVVAMNICVYSIVALRARDASLARAAESRPFEAD